MMDEDFNWIKNVKNIECTNTFRIHPNSDSKFPEEDYIYECSIYTEFPDRNNNLYAKTYHVKVMNPSIYNKSIHSVNTALTTYGFCRINQSGKIFTPLPHTSCKTYSETPSHWNIGKRSRITLEELYEEETGNEAIWRGKDSIGYIKWKNEFLSSSHIRILKDTDIQIEPQEPEPITKKLQPTPAEQKRDVWDLWKNLLKKGASEEKLNEVIKRLDDIK
ncbi:hypothetical protein LCGC14_0223450 [marine sediment metagenome]|uniref:Uncharacterized protein n=1 Tax=marine sediment metagenome TaxID=412755 RepID=A0A0F9UTG4_9ZZZZ|nr:hypothetical protein [bacterium]